MEELRALKPDVIAVVAYGRILPQAVLDIPSRGCINIHASLLPALRGSGPVQWAVLRGLEETGVTAMYMAAEMDAGDMIATRRTPIDPNENAQSLLDRLAKLGAELLAETLTRLAQGPVAATPQDHTKATFAPMLTKDLCPIDWSRTPREIWNHIRGLDPWPVATMELQGKRFRVYQGGPPGENHKPDPRHAPGRDPDRPGDGLRRGRRAGDPGFAGRRGQAHGRAGLLPGPSLGPVRRRYGCKTDGFRRAHCLPEARGLVRRCDEGICPAGPAGPAGGCLGRRLCYGVLQNRMLLDYYLSQLVRGRLRDLQPVVLDILRLGLYQILCMDKIPDSAAVNEAVEQGKKYANSRAAGLINGVLRSAIRRRGALEEPRDLATRYSHPQPLVELLAGEMEPEDLERVLAADNQAPETVLQAQPSGRGSRGASRRHPKAPGAAVCRTLGWSAAS